MPTYDGLKIVTGTLYENGNIITKNGFSRTSEDGDIEAPSLVSMQRKSGIIVEDSKKDSDGVIQGPALVATKKQVVILTSADQKDCDGKLGAPSLLSMKKQVVIIQA